jgi:hypothetical protein
VASTSTRGQDAAAGPVHEPEVVGAAPVAGHDVFRRVVAPLLVFAASRVVVLVAMETVRRLRAPPLLSFASLSAQWDGAWYLDVVRNGYAGQLTIGADGEALASNHVFFPLYPLTIRAVDFLVPGGDIVAGLVITLLAAAVAVVLLREVARLLVGDDAADRTVLVFCFFPGTLALSWVYADGLMVALVAGSMLLLARDQLLAASFVSAFATATRPNALPIALACAWVAAERHGPLLVRAARATATGALAASGAIAFHLFLAVHTGEAFAWFELERDVWGEGRPFNRLHHVVITHADSGTGFMRVTALVAVALAIGGLLVVLLSALPAWAKVIAVGAVYLTVSSTTSPRQLLAGLPLFIAAGARLRGVGLTVAIGMFGAGLMLSAFVYLYPSGHFGWAP